MRQARELLQLPLGKGRAHRGDDRLEPGLVQGEHVGVALDHDRALLLRDRRARAVEAVEQVALAEELALRRVDVLRAQRIVLAQLARLEPAHAPARVGQREEQAPVEVVVAAAVGEPGCAQLLRGESLLPRFPRERRAAGREPEPVLAADLLAETAALEVRARRLTARRLPEVALVERGRLLEQREQPLAPPTLRGPAPGELSSYSSGTLNRSASNSIAPTKSRFSCLLDERDRVPALAATEALEGASVRRDREAWRLLLVERAQAGETRAGLAQPRVTPDERRRCRQPP